MDAFFDLLLREESEQSFHNHLQKPLQVKSQLLTRQAILKLVKDHRDRVQTQEKAAHGGQIRSATGMRVGGEWRFLGSRKAFSEADIDGLQKVMIADMESPKRHNGNYLLCRTICPPARDMSVLLAIEDESESVTLLSLSYYPTLPPKPSLSSLDALFPPGTVLAIFEPHMRTSSSLSTPNVTSSRSRTTTSSPHIISVTSATDIIFLGPSNPLLLQSPWANYGTVEVLRARGDKLYNASHFLAAIHSWTHALEIAPDSRKLLLNRCQAYNRLGWYELALKDATHASNLLGPTPVPAPPSPIPPSSSSKTTLPVPFTISIPSEAQDKADYRAGVALYGMGRYNEAFELFSGLLERGRNVKEVGGYVERCRRRKREAKDGEKAYDWLRMFEEVQSRFLAKGVNETQASSVDVAPFVGPIRVCGVSGGMVMGDGADSGARCVRTTRDVRAGELLVVSKAYTTSDFLSKAEQGQLNALHVPTRTIPSLTELGLLSNIITRLYGRPSEIPRIHDLYSGPSEHFTTSPYLSSTSTSTLTPSTSLTVSYSPTTSSSTLSPPPHPLSTTSFMVASASSSSSPSFLSRRVGRSRTPSPLPPPLTLSVPSSPSTSSQCTERPHPSTSLISLSQSTLLTSPSQSRASHTATKTSVSLDSTLIENLTLTNLFTGPLISLPSLSSNPDLPTASALHTSSPSFFHRCCYPNASWRFWGDVMVVRANRDIGRDEEVTLALDGGIGGIGRNRYRTGRRESRSPGALPSPPPPPSPSLSPLPSISSSRYSQSQSQADHASAHICNCELCTWERQDGAAAVSLRGNIRSIDLRKCTTEIELQHVIHTLQMSYNASSSSSGGGRRVKPALIDAHDEAMQWYQNRANNITGSRSGLKEKEKEVYFREAAYHGIEAVRAAGMEVLSSFSGFEGEWVVVGGSGGGGGGGGGERGRRDRCSSLLSSPVSSISPVPSTSPASPLSTDHGGQDDDKDKKRERPRSSLSTSNKRRSILSSFRLSTISNSTSSASTSTSIRSSFSSFTSFASSSPSFNRSKNQAYTSASGETAEGEGVSEYSLPVGKTSLPMDPRVQDQCVFIMTQVVAMLMMGKEGKEARRWLRAAWFLHESTVGGGRALFDRRFKETARLWSVFDTVEYRWD